MSFNVGPRVVSATGGSIKRVGNYRIHTFPSELVTDGLVLNLDAGDPRSYPGSGSTWTDLSGNGNNGTFGASTAAPTYNNANGGSLTFDGTNDYVSLGTPSIGTGKITVSAWIKITTGGIYQHIVDNQSPEWHLAILNDNRPYFFNGVVNHNSTLQLSTGVWYMITGVQGITNDLYINGVLSQSIESNVNITTNTPHIGRWYNGPSRYFNGNISNVSIYNRALSAAEIAQNYDALKVRYTSYTNTFTPTCGGGSGKVEVLCVAGGGGGASGGGGAGGLLYNSAFTVSSNTSIGVTVGAGGTSGNCDANAGAAAVSGQSSSFSSLSSVGGGNGGQAGGTQTGGNGGSGGGAAANGGGSNNGGTGTSGQGFNGGGNGGFTSFPYGVGGGGGSAGAAITATSAQAFPGGNGLTFAISGTSSSYSGGGGGGAYSGSLNGSGGTGGGGNGGSGGSVGTSAIPNTGSGGGGGAAGVLGGNGSNGIIIVRYPATDYNVELLIVGGGGGGGGSVVGYGGGGGGGSGGLLYYSSYPVSAGTKYTITVGAGGTGQNASPGANGSNGNNSVFGSIVAFGGGGGSYGNGDGTANNGGSGGGGGYRGYNTVANGGTGVAGQGNNGGGVLSISASGGGGGGAGGVGQSNTGAGAGVGGVGGVGLTYAITGSSITYAAGGQGGNGASVPGSANTGNGGAGTYANSNSNTGYAGGSGIIIIAYQGPQRGVGGTVDTTSRPGYTLHKFTTTGTDFFIP